MSEQFTPPEQKLVERLQRAPQPELAPDAKDAILARLLNAVDNPPVPDPAPRPPLTNPLVLVAVLVIGVLLGAGVVFLLTRPQNPPPVPTSTAIPTVLPATPLPAVVSSPVPSVTVTSTAAPTVIPTIEVTATIEATLTSTAALTATATVGLTATVTVMPTMTINTITVIEGPIQQIDGTIITIYDIPVQLNPSDPLLPVIAIGDIVRIEGNNNGQIVVVTGTVVTTNVDVNTSTGDVWRDDGNCANPPPDWAPANGWRRRCQGQDKPGNQNAGNSQHDDDKDDDD